MESHNSTNEYFQRIKTQFNVISNHLLIDYSMGENSHSCRTFNACMYLLRLPTRDIKPRHVQLKNSESCSL